MASHASKSAVDSQVKKNWEKDGLDGVRKRISAKDRRVATKQIERAVAASLDENSVDFNDHFSYKPKKF